MFKGLWVGAVLAALLLTACSGDDDSSPTATATEDSAAAETPDASATEAPTAAATPTEAPSGSITVYSGRGESLIGALIEEFETETGIDVEVRYGGSAAMAATIAEEGGATPADVFWSQDPGPLGALADRFTELPDDLLERVDTRFRSPDGHWVGVSGRVRVITYNPDLIEVSEIPNTLADLTDPVWNGRVGWAPANASFQVMVTGMRHLWGEEETRSWLEAMQANNTQAFGNNIQTVEAVADGEVEIGLVNHYYLGALKEANPNLAAENYYLNNDDPGSLVMVSGVGILQETDNLPAAQAFVDYLLSESAQRYFVDETTEYALIGGIETPEGLTPLEDLVGPEIDLADLADVEGTLNLLRDLGILD